MTDKTIPADKVRPILDEWERIKEHADWEAMDNLVQEVRALLPAPTLADMTPEERAACQWMQADIIGGDEPLVITRIDRTDGTALILDRNGCLDGVPAEHVTPRPDLPRMTWPDDTPAPAPIDPEDCPPRDQLTLGAKWADIDKLEEALRRKGEAADQAIVLDDEGDAYVWETVGRGRWMFRVPVQQCGPFRLILTGKEAGDVTPAPKAGDVIESADDPRLDTLPVGSVLADCDGDEVEKTGRGWKGDGYIPRPIEGDKFGSWTVCRIGKEDDQ